MRDTPERQRPLLALEGLVDEVCLSSSPTSMESVGVASLHSRVITLPVRISHEEFIAYNSKSDPRLRWETPWFPRLWSDEIVVEQLLHTLCAGIQSPLFWTIGRYERKEVERLVDEGDVPANAVESLLKSYKGDPRALHWMPIIVQWTQRERIWMPEDQGRFHSFGAAIAVFEGDSSRDDVRRAWVDAMRSGEPKLNEMLYAGRIAPSGAVALLVPFGDENREHAVIARAGWDSHTLLRNVVMGLSARLVEVEMSQAMFRQWEGNQMLPPEIEHAL